MSSTLEMSSTSLCSVWPAFFAKQSKAMKAQTISSQLLLGGLE